MQDRYDSLSSKMTEMFNFLAFSEIQMGHFERNKVLQRQDQVPKMMIWFHK